MRKKAEAEAQRKSEEEARRQAEEAERRRAEEKAAQEESGQRLEVATGPQPAAAPVGGEQEAPGEAGQKVVNPISLNMSRALTGVREEWFGVCLEKIRACNAQAKQAARKISIRQETLGGEAEAALKAYQIHLVRRYLARYKYLADNAGVGFMQKLTAYTFGEQQEICEAYLNQFTDLLASDPELLANEPKQYEHVAQDIAGYVTGFPRSTEAVRQVAATFSEFVDVNLLESARALGDKKTVIKLTNKLANLPHRRSAKKDK